VFVIAVRPHPGTVLCGSSFHRLIVRIVLTVGSFGAGASRSASLPQPFSFALPA
jgi:hypothetical protein